MQAGGHEFESRILHFIRSAAEKSAAFLCAKKYIIISILQRKEKKEENKIIVKQDGMITRKENFIMKENLKSTYAQRKARKQMVTQPLHFTRWKMFSKKMV